MNDLLEAALTYAARGWKVMPLHGIVDGKCTCGEDHESDGRAGKHPILSGSFERVATGDAQIINGWWLKHPNANVAIATGAPSGCWVLDVDPDGFPDLEEYEKRNGPLETLRAQTGRGGWHFFWKYHPDDRVRSRNAARLGIDVKSDGGYVAVPPSRHANGNTYIWATEGRVGVRAPAPEVLLWIKTPNNKASGNGQVGEGQDFPSIEEMLANGLPEGMRDEGIFHAALKLLDAGMSEHDVRLTITTIALKCTPAFPLPDAQGKVTAALAYRIRREERYNDDQVAPELLNWAKSLTVDEPTASVLWRGYGEIDDNANAWRLYDRWPEARPLESGGWIVCNDKDLWVRVKRPAHEAIGRLRAVLEQEMEMIGGDSDRLKALAKFALRSRSASGIHSALGLCESNRLMWIRDDELDADKWMLSLEENVLVVKEGVTRDRTRLDLMTLVAGGGWESREADCPLFKETMMLGTSSMDEELQAQTLEALQMFFGVCMTGVPLKNFIILNGPGNSGKSSVVEGFARALGDYAATAPRGLLTSRPGRIMDHPTIYKTLQGKRFMYGSEPGVGEELNVDLIKDITSGGSITARGMGENFSSFVAEAKILVDTNNWLKFRETTKALEERMILLDFPYEIPADRRMSRDYVRSRLDAEAAGILAWAWRGLKRVLELGGEEGMGDLTPLLGERILERRREAVEEQDVVGRYVRERLVVDGGEGFVSKDEIRDDIHMWLAYKGIRFNQESFVAEVTRRLRAGPSSLRVREEKRTVEGGRKMGWAGMSFVGPTIEGEGPRL